MKTVKYEAVLLSVHGYACFDGDVEVEDWRKGWAQTQIQELSIAHRIITRPMAHTVFYLRKFRDVQASTQTGI